jgi:hypothetical protein
MTEITGITLDPKQNMTLVLPDNSTAPFYLEYIDSQQGWFFSISYGSNWTGVTYQRIVTGANMLRAYRNIIPFGLGCMTTDGLEPIFISDFFNGRASLFILDSIDVQSFEGILNVN